MITSMRRSVACDDLWPWPISSRSFDLEFENRVRSVTFSVLDRLFFWLGIQYDSIVWVIMRRRGVSSERRHSSCSNFFCPSVRLSVCHTFFTMFPSSYHHEIFMRYYQWPKRGPCQRWRSEVKVTEVKTQLHHFRTITPVWIHIWWWNEAQSLMLPRSGALLFFKVICQISWSQGSINRRFWPKLGVSVL